MLTHPNALDGITIATNIHCVNTLSKEKVVAKLNMVKVICMHRKYGEF